MKISEAQWKQFKDLTEPTDDELRSIIVVTEYLQGPYPRGKMDIQTQMFNVDKMMDTISNMILSIKLTRVGIFRKRSDIYAKAYATGRMSMNDRAIEQTLMYDSDEYKNLVDKLGQLDIWISKFESLIWNLKGRKSSLDKAHATDY